MLNKNKRYVEQKKLDFQKRIVNRIKSSNEVEYDKTGKKKLCHIVTYGCQLNNADSETLGGILKEMGYENTDDKNEADLIIFNTCCVRENAELKLYGNIGALKSLKNEKPELIIAVCGCMMQQKHAVETIKKKYRHVDLIFGTHNIYMFPELLEKVLNERSTLVSILETEGFIADDLPVVRKEKHKAWITIMYGCNNFCSYCIVPYVRGRERSRRPSDIIDEIKALAEDNYKEITLLGQNVNSYGKDFDEAYDFADLLCEINRIEGIERIRFMTSHPKDISDKLIYAMKNCEKVCEHLHLPFQAGSDKILKLMNRKYTKDEYMKKINKIRNEMPDIALTTDIIVGFPGETREDFQETLDIVKEVRFDQAYTFIYSKRIGTPAFDMEDLTTDKEKHENFDELIEIQNQISKEINDTYLGKIVEVLIDGVSKNNPKRLTGRTRTGKIVNFNGKGKRAGDLVNVRINEIFSWSLNGELV
jgi:tRNA-2-methylthio-N6-dimethylallyladenosine synthase